MIEGEASPYPKAKLGPTDETKYRHSAPGRHPMCRNILRREADLNSSRRSGQSLELRRPLQPETNYAFFDLVPITFALTVLGMVNCSTPFCRMAVPFLASTLAGSSMILRIWSQQHSE